MTPISYRTTSIPIKNIINDIRRCISQIKQWEESGNYENCSKYKNSAEALLTVLEVFARTFATGKELKDIPWPHGKEALINRLDYMIKLYKYGE